MSRIRCLLLLTVGLLTLACAGPARVGQDPAAADRGTEPKYGGTAIMGMNDTPENTHYYVSVSRGTQVTFNHYYEPLVGLDQREEFRIDLPLRPWLAESWEQLNDTTYVFKIRQGVTWHDGKAFSPEDAAWSLLYLRDPANRFQNRNYVHDTDQIVAPGDGTLRITLKAVNPYFLQDLREVHIMPRHVFEAGGAEALATKSTSTGSFELASVERTSRTKFKRNPNYWGRDEKGRQQPYLDGIDFVHNMDMSAQRAAFAAGQNDVIQFPDRAELNGFTQRLTRKDFKIIDFHYANGPGFMINVKRPPFNNPDVRRAAHLVINRQLINDNFSSGEGLYSTPIVPAMKTGWGMSQEELLKLPGWRAGAEKAKDLEEARALLRKAGVTPDQVEFRVIATSTWTTLPEAEQAVGQWKQFGFKVRYEPLDGAAFQREQREGNWDLSWQVAHSHYYLTRAGRPFLTGGSANYGGISDPELDAVLEAMVRTNKVDEQKRHARQAQQIILDRVYGYPIVDQRLFETVQPWLFGYGSGRATQPDFHGSTPFMWIDTDILPSGRK